MSDVFTDPAGNPLAIGTRVQIAACPADPEFVGEIVDMTEADYDNDPEGATYVVPPMVVVLFDDGREDAFVGKCTDSDDMGPFGPLVVGQLAALGVPA